MRTKTLVTAAVAALGAASALAVQSVNVVGYVNVDFPDAFKNKMLTVPLQAANNNVSSILPNGPDGCTIQKWNPLISQFDIIANYIEGVGWDPDVTLAPGEGFAIQVGAATTITFVGDVRESRNQAGAPLTTPLANGYNLVGSQVAQQGAIETVLGFDPNQAPSGVNVQIWDVAAQGYSPVIYGFIPGVGWDPSEPALGMAEACILVTGDDGLSWSRTFNVQ